MGAILQQHPRVSCVDTITVVVPLRFDFVAADLPGLDVEPLCGAQAGEACVPWRQGRPNRTPTAGRMLHGRLSCWVHTAHSLPASFRRIQRLRCALPGRPLSGMQQEIWVPVLRYKYLLCAWESSSSLSAWSYWSPFGHNSSHTVAAEQYHAAVACNRCTNASTESLPA